MRKVYNFNTKWAFSKEATEAPKEMPQKWYWVSLPHTWNDIDGQDGGNDLYRGTSFYAKELEKIEERTKYFIKEKKQMEELYQFMNEAKQKIEIADSFKDKEDVRDAGGT